MMKINITFSSNFGFSCLKAYISHCSAWSLSVYGKALQPKRGWEKMEKGRSHPFLECSSGIKRSLWLNRAALKRCQIHFLCVVKLTTSGKGFELKGNKQEIAYSIASVLISSFETWTHLLLLPLVASLCACVQAPGAWEDPFLSPAEEGHNQGMCSLAFWPETILDHLGQPKRCAAHAAGSPIGPCSHITASYHLNHLSKVADLKLQTTFWFTTRIILQVVGWKCPFQNDNDTQVQDCFCSVISLNYHSGKRLEVVFRLKFPSAWIQMEVKKYFL